MELKTKVTAEEGKQEILITRVFDLPADLVFRAHTEPELVEQWMGNKVKKMENRDHGSYEFEVRDKEGNVLMHANGCIHKITENQTIIRTFEMDSAGFPVQLEFLDFESISDEQCKLSIRMVYRSVSDRDNMLKLPFVQGINMAHNQLEKLIGKHK